MFIKFILIAFLHSISFIYCSENVSNRGSKSLNQVVANFVQLVTEKDKASSLVLEFETFVKSIVDEIESVGTEAVIGKAQQFYSKLDQSINALTKISMDVSFLPFSDNRDVTYAVTQSKEMAVAIAEELSIDLEQKKNSDMLRVCGALVKEGKSILNGTPPSVELTEFLVYLEKTSSEVKSLLECHKSDVHTFFEKDGKSAIIKKYKEQRKTMTDSQSKNLKQLETKLQDLQKKFTKKIAKPQTP